MTLRLIQPDIVNVSESSTVSIPVCVQLVGMSVDLQRDVVVDLVLRTEDRYVRQSKLVIEIIHGTLVRPVLSITQSNC